MTEPHRGNFLRRLFLVERSEVAPLSWAMGYFFFVLASYFVLRPVRESLGAKHFDQEGFAELYLRTFLIMLVVAPIYAWVSHRLAKRTLLLTVYGAALVFLGVFAVGFAGADADLERILAGVFYNWISVYNLIAVSIFWSVVSDVFTEGQGKRLFGPIAIGGTTGALFGSTFTNAYADLGYPGLLVSSFVLLGFGVVCMLRLIARPATTEEASKAGRERSERIEGSLWSGFVLIARSLYLQGICAYMLLGTFVATLVYFFQIEVVKELALEDDARTALFARINTWSQVATLLVQIFITSRALRSLGVGLTLATLPVFYIAGFGVLGALPTLITVAGFDVGRRAVLHGVSKPSKELLFTLVSDDARYRSKNFIDTAVYRGGDWLSATTFATLQGTARLGALAFYAIPLCVVWLLLALWLGREVRRLE